MANYAAKDAEFTLRVWREFAAIDAERARERRHRIAAAVAFGALAVAILAEVFR